MGLFLEGKLLIPIIPTSHECSINWGSFMSTAIMGTGVQFNSTELEWNKCIIAILYRISLLLSLPTFT